MKHLMHLCLVLFVCAAIPVSGYVHQSTTLGLHQPQQPPLLEKVKSGIIAKKATWQPKILRQIEAIIHPKKALSSDDNILNGWFWFGIIGFVLGILLYFGGIISLGITEGAIISGVIVIAGLALILFGLASGLVWLIKLIINLAEE